MKSLVKVVFAAACDYPAYLAKNNQSKKNKMTQKKSTQSFDPLSNTLLHNKNTLQRLGIDISQ